MLSKTPVFNHRVGNMPSEILVNCMSRILLKSRHFIRNRRILTIYPYPYFICSQYFSKSSLKIKTRVSFSRNRPFSNLSTNSCLIPYCNTTSSSKTKLMY